MLEPVDELDVPPGSSEAVSYGCLCPVHSNHYGRGYRGNGIEYGWLCASDCPIHGVEVELCPN